MVPCRRQICSRSGSESSNMFGIQRNLVQHVRSDSPHKLPELSSLNIENILDFEALKITSALSVITLGELGVLLTEY
jgi:hypothetical protein